MCCKELQRLLGHKPSTCTRLLKESERERKEREDRTREKEDEKESECECECESERGACVCARKKPRENKREGHRNRELERGLLPMCCQCIASVLAMCCQEKQRVREGLAESGNSYHISNTLTTHWQHIGNTLAIH
jgi:hypothetical protein